MPFEAATTAMATEDRAAELANDTTLKVLSPSPEQTMTPVESSGIHTAPVNEAAADTHKSGVSAHRSPSVGPHSFEKIRVLGVGSTGRVYLVRSIVRRVLVRLMGAVRR